MGRRTGLRLKKTEPALPNLTPNPANQLLKPPLWPYLVPWTPPAPVCVNNPPKNGKAPSILGAPSNKKTAWPRPSNILDLSSMEQRLAHCVSVSGGKFSPLLLFSHSLSLFFFPSFKMTLFSYVLNVCFFLFWNNPCFFALRIISVQKCLKSEAELKIEMISRSILTSSLFVLVAFWFFFCWHDAVMLAKNKNKNVKNLYHLWNMYKRDM